MKMILYIICILESYIDDEAVFANVLRKNFEFIQNYACLLFTTE